MHPSPLPTLASDTYAPVHPDILAALARVNDGPAPAYGADPVTIQAEETLRRLFRHPDLRALPVFNGTGANVVALSSVIRPFESVLCAETAHVVVDECGAVEKISGSKLVTFATPDGKLRPEQLEGALKRRGDVHHAQPRVISVSQTTEYGTLYDVKELRALAEFAHANGMLLHVDGSRASNAVVALGCDFHEAFVRPGVDLLSLGATKNGAMAAEAVVYLRPELAQDAGFFRKQATQLASKQRYVSAQLEVMFGTELWRRNAEAANGLARRLAEGLRAKGVRLTQEPAANAVFVELPREKAEALQRRFSFYAWNELRSEYRLMTSFATDPALVDEFLAAL